MAKPELGVGKASPNFVALTGQNSRFQVISCQSVTSQPAFSNARNIVGILAGNPQALLDNAF